MRVAPLSCSPPSCCSSFLLADAAAAEAAAVDLPPDDLLLLDFFVGSAAAAAGEDESSSSSLSVCSFLGFEDFFGDGTVKGVRGKKVFSFFFVFLRTIATLQFEHGFVD
jgi:hypothetical protein